VISKGSEALMEFLESGGIPELAEEIQNYRQAAEKDDVELENLELRPEEHESYQGDDDNQDVEVSPFSIQNSG